MRLLRPLAILALAVAVAGCTSAAGNVGWTFSPTPTPSAGPSGSGAAPSGPAASGPAASGSGQAGGSAQPGASGQAGGSAISLTAQNIAFDKKDLTAPANAAFTINFANNDQGVPHNVYIQNASGSDIFKGDNVDGGSSTTYNVPALQPGTYKFYCAIHPTLMTGTLTVK